MEASDNEGRAGCSGSAGFGNTPVSHMYMQCCTVVLMPAVLGCCVSVLSTQLRCWHISCATVFLIFIACCCWTQCPLALGQVDLCLLSRRWARTGYGLETARRCPVSRRTWSSSRCRAGLFQVLRRRTAATGQIGPNFRVSTASSTTPPLRGTLQTDATSWLK